MHKYSYNIIIQTRIINNITIISINKKYTPIILFFILVYEIISCQILIQFYDIYSFKIDLNFESFCNECDRVD